MLPPGRVCRDHCCRKRSGGGIAGIHGRYAGSGSRELHQLGKTPIWPLPTRTYFVSPNTMPTTQNASSYSAFGGSGLSENEWDFDRKRDQRSPMGNLST